MHRAQHLVILIIMAAILAGCQHRMDIRPLKIEQVSVSPQAIQAGRSTDCTLVITLDAPFDGPLTVETRGAIIQGGVCSRILETDSRFLSFTLPLAPALQTGPARLSITCSDNRGHRVRTRTTVTVDAPPPPADGIGAPASVSARRQASGSKLSSASRVEVLESGPEAFERWRDLITDAEQSILLQTYYLDDEGLCGQLVELLELKARAGVNVNIILTHYSQMGTAPLLPRRLKRQGVNVVLAGDIGLPREAAGRSLPWLEKMRSDYHIYEEIPHKPPFDSWMQDRRKTMKIDFALHEKLLVVDGKTAIMGGRNLQDDYFFWWHDLDVLLEGPVVSELTEAFRRTWSTFDDRELPPPPPPVPAGPTAVRLVQSVPWEGRYSTVDLLCTAMTQARNHIYISSQYLALPPCLRDALTKAAARGVDVRILTNSRASSQEVAHGLCHYISLNHYPDLIDAGVRIFEYRPDTDDIQLKPYLHAKEFLIDGQWLAIGSFNLSIRSAYLESELLAVFPDAALAATRDRRFLEVLERSSREVLPRELKVREAASGWLIRLAYHAQILY